ncbi:MAG: restriction endonuclease subunit S [Bacteroidales bacterium]|nr:restriction endonuclease subunit S [Bacteroidales bacterium]
MNKIEQLIQQLCPDGVEFKELQEVVYLTMGTSPAGNTFVSNPNDGIEFHQGKTSFGNEIIKHSSIYTTSPIKVAEPNSLIMSVRAPVGDTNLTNRKIAIGRGLCSMVGKNALMTKFLYYFINENINTFKNKSNGSTFEAINTQEIKKIKIPIPPLPIQQEIVTILDKFTRLEAELEAELEARRKQYEYYRNELLNFDGKEVEWKMLGEVGKVCMCKRVMKYETKSMGDIPFYKIGTFGKEADAFISKKLHDDYKRRFSFPKIGDILISASGTIGRTVVYDGKPAYFQDSNIVWIDNDECKVTNRFLSYYYKIVEWKVDGGTISRLYNDNLAKTKIPIPPLSEQNRIVEILDKFDALVASTSSATEGLPAEIAARRKQYEYYRGKLLDFRPLKK